MEQPQDYRSFLVRLWREVGDDGLDRWCGEVEQIQNGSLRRFTSLDNLTLLLQPDASPDPWLAPDSAPGNAA